MCESNAWQFTDLSRVQTNGTLYNGNVTAYDWLGGLDRKAMSVRYINNVPHSHEGLS